MKKHIVLKDPIDFKSIEEEFQAGQKPKFDLEVLSQRLKATFEMPKKAYRTLPQDNLRSKIMGDSESWAFARALSFRVDQDDFIYCPGEDIGIPVAALCGGKSDRPKIAIFCHNIDRPRGRAALKLFNLAKRVDLFIANSRTELNFIRNYLNVPDSQVHFVWHPIDCNFFTPGLPSPNKKRPIIASVGLEKRDYRLLAQATQDLDVDVKVAGFSQFFSRVARSFPKTMPANMSNRRYQLSEIVQLYRDADVVAICVEQNPGSYGVTTLLEAMACRRPVVATRTEGLADYFSDPDAIMTVEPGDHVGLQKAILHLLNNPQEAEERAQRAYQLVRERHNLDKFAENVAQLIESLDVP
ncbi:glycosyltransferase family 4 protein [Pleurocapsales cyanobacterium LEGE 10410]|nr:glycosyltransferase family 4 protein [Pleurocapsales cyanobacterium LEGE 10410]